jgi:membrane-bound lytic murein transglycosylase D
MKVLVRFSLLALFLIMCFSINSNAKTLKKSHQHPKRKVTKTVPVNTKNDSLYRARLEILPVDFKDFYNANVRKAIELYTIRSPRTTARFVGMSKIYFPVIEQVFAQYGIPKEMEYIAIVESSLNPKATGRGVTGMWQFTKGTGLKFGLAVNTNVDERRALYESTIAVAHYLQLLYNMYGDWRYVIAAYNCGYGCVNHIIKISGGSQNFWKVYHRLPPVTQKFIPTFLGIAYAVNYYNKYNIIPVKPLLPDSIDTIHINKALYLSQISQTLKISPDTLKELNPQYIQNYIPANENKSFTICLPAGVKNRFLNLKDSVYACKINLPKTKSGAHSYAVNTSGKGKVIYTVKPGENLSIISRRYKIAIDKIKAWNNLKSNMLHPKQKIIIYLN